MFEVVPLSGIDLECVDGEYRTFYGCSLEGLFEFEQRRLELYRLCAELDATIPDLYRQSNRFRFLVNRCLILNGIQPAWVSPRQLEQLLFVRETPEGLRLGLLVELNTPPKPTEPVTEERKPPTLEESIAALATQCSGIAEAIQLARTEPAKHLMAVATAKAELSKPPEEKRRKDLRNFAQQERQRAREQAQREAQQAQARQEG